MRNMLTATPGVRPRKRQCIKRAVLARRVTATKRCRKQPVKYSTMAFYIGNLARGSRTSGISSASSRLRPASTLDNGSTISRWPPSIRVVPSNSYYPDRETLIMIWKAASVRASKDHQSQRREPRSQHGGGSGEQLVTFHVHSSRRLPEQFTHDSVEQKNIPTRRC